MAGSFSIKASNFSKPVVLSIRLTLELSGARQRVRSVGSFEFTNTLNPHRCTRMVLPTTLCTAASNARRLPPRGGCGAARAALRQSSCTIGATDNGQDAQRTSAVNGMRTPEQTSKENPRGQRDFALIRRVPSTVAICRAPPVQLRESAIIADAGEQAAEQYRRYFNDRNGSPAPRTSKRF